MQERLDSVRYAEQILGSEVQKGIRRFQRKGVEKQEKATSWRENPALIESLIVLATPRIYATMIIDYREGLLTTGKVSMANTRSEEQCKERITGLLSLLQ